jgi:hypothetical protein
MMKGGRPKTELFDFSCEYAFDLAVRNHALTGAIAIGGEDCQLGDVFPAD